VAVSKVAIANRALQKLGAKRIEALSQDHPNARSINACFDVLRDKLLRRYDWSFAIKRASIAADGEAPTWGDWDRYSLPNDFIRLMRDNETGIAPDWKIEGLHILSGDASPLQIRYIARITDTAFYDAAFVEALAADIAFECCEEITGATTKKESMREDKAEAIAEGRSTGAFEKDGQEFPEDDWIAARR
jgi:hypothetical protein